MADAGVASAPPRRAGRPVSLALRLTVSIGLVTTVIFLALGWIIERSIDHHFALQDAEELDVVARLVERVVRTTPRDAALDVWQERLAGVVQGHERMHYYVRDPAGRVVFQKRGPDLAAVARERRAVAAVDPGQLVEWTETVRGDLGVVQTPAAPAHADGPAGPHGAAPADDAAQSYRGAVLQFPAPQGGGAYTVVVATGTAFHEHFIAAFRRTVWALTSVAALFAILATWIAVRRGHAPLREVSRRIRGITANQLHMRLDPDRVPIELADLTRSFNTMIERIEEDFRRLSNFSADIAHELRTPVTNLVTQAQVLLGKERDASAYREALYSNLEEYERMAKMIGDMLYLAQTDNQLIKPELASVDLAAEIEALFEYFEPWAEERRVGLARTGQGRAVPGDRLMLRRALSNLLSNAIRHTPAGGVVTAALRDDGEALVVRVENPGETIPAEHLPRLFDRFYRVDPSRQRNGDGAGLGLAIVKSIVEAHGGQIGVTSGDGMTAFEMRLIANGDSH